MPEVDLFADETDGAVVTLSKKDKQRVAYLERILTVLAQQHGEGLPTVNPDTDEPVSDTEFDKMWDELEKLDPDATKRVGNASAPPLDPNAKKVKHDPPMTSIKKANGTLQERTDAFEKWVALVGKELGKTREQVLDCIVVSYKHDGAAVSITYKNGELVSAGLRPRHGVWGEDVTENIKFVQNVPTKLPLPLSCVIRGELECRISTFNKLNGTAQVGGQEFANPRNYTTGSIRQYKDPTVTKSRCLSFTAYRILGLQKMPAKTERELAIWANKNLGINFVRTEKWTPTIFAEMEAKVPELDYEVDGAVASIDDFEDQEQLGTYGGAVDANPRGKLAWKFADDTAEPTISDIVWEIGRGGDATPVAHFPGVKLAGTTVVKATAFSLGFLVRNNIHVGSKIRIRKSGKIIPEILGAYDANGVYHDKIEAGDKSLPADLRVDTFTRPVSCPSCGTTLSVVQGGSHGMISLVCENHDECPAQNVKLFLNYLEKFGVKGLGEATVEQIVEAGLVRKFSDFYTLTVTELRNAGRSIRESLLDIARIHMIDAPEQIKDNQELAKLTVDAIKRKKHISLSKFIACLGIPGASKGTGTALAMHFRDLKAILDACETDFASVADVGEKTAKTLCDYFHKHREDIETLMNEHLEIELPKSGRYTGKNFVFTGGQPEGKDYWKEAVEAEGGIVKGSVSKDIDYVIIGADAGSKAEKAQEMKAKGHKLIIVDSHDALVKMFK